MQIARVLAFGLPLVAASPAARRNAIDGCKVAKIVAVLKLHQATSFCSAFLGIETSTATVYATETSTSTQEIDGPTVTSTSYLAPITSTNIVDQTDTATVTVTQEATSTINGITTETSTAETTTTVIYSIGVNGRKRSPNPNLPDFVSGFASSAISKACSRLAIPTPVTTTTVDVTATSVATSTGEPVTVDVSVGTTTTVESTLLVTSTETATSTTTALTTEYSTTGVVTSTTATVSQLAICSPGPNAPYNQPLGYPSRFPLAGNQDPTEMPDVQACCEACYARQNCVAASWDVPSSRCFFATAINEDGTTPAPPELADRCPLGVGGNGVTQPGQGGVWFPGPCVY